MNDMPMRRERSSLNAFAINRLDRREDLRMKPDAILALRHRSDTRIIAVAGETPILNRTEGDTLSVWFSHGEAERLGPAQEEAFLGMAEDGSPRFGRLLDRASVEALKERTDLVVTDLRSVAIKQLVPEDEAGPLGEAKALLDWHARHRFCAQCGGQTVSGASGWRRECNACGAMHFPRTDPVVIMLVVRGDKCLLARQARYAPGVFSSISGFVEPGETLEDAVRRESWEEAGLRIGAVRYLATQPWPFPSSIMIGFIAEAISEDITLDATELEAGRWFPRDEVLQMLEGRHPDGLSCPQGIGISSMLVRIWALEGERP